MDKLTVYSFDPRTIRNYPGLSPSWRFVIVKGEAIVWDKETEIVVSVGWKKKANNDCRATSEALPKKLVMPRKLYSGVSVVARETLQTLDVVLV